MRPSIGGSPEYYYFISNFVKFLQTDTPVLTNYILRWPPSDDDPPDTDDFKDWLDNSYSFCITLLNDWLLPSSTLPYSAHLGFFFPCLLLSVPSALGCFLLLPISPPIFVQLYSFVLHSSASEAVAEPDSPTIPQSTKAIAREAQICLI